MAATRCCDTRQELGASVGEGALCEETDLRASWVRARWGSAEAMEKTKEEMTFTERLLRTHS